MRKKTAYMICTTIACFFSILFILLFSFLKKTNYSFVIIVGLLICLAFFAVFTGAAYFLK